nr:MLP-like protein 28 [Nicotiana tomentosiformis]
MGVKGKLIASVEVKCGGHLVHDIIHTNTHHLPNICPGKLNGFEIHEGGTVKVGSVVIWKYNDDGKDKIAKQVIEAIDHQKKSITWKVIGGDLLELYNSFTIISSNDHQWTTWTFVYEKKTEDVPEPLVLLGLALGVTKDIECHLLNFTTFLSYEGETMGLKGKLTASVEVECGGHLFHDLYQNNPHQLCTISPSKVKHFEILKGGIIKIGSIVSWKYNNGGKDTTVKEVIEAIDPQKKSITWKVIEGDLLELYNSFTIITSCEQQWTTWTLVYDKKTKDIPEPIALLGCALDMTKDIEDHLLKK